MSLFTKKNRPISSHKFQDGTFVNVYSRQYGSGYNVTGNAIRGLEVVHDMGMLHDMIRQLSQEHGGLLNELERREKSEKMFINESPDSIKVGENSYYYISKNNVVTGFNFANKLLGGKMTIVGYSAVNKKVIAYSGDREQDNVLRDILNDYLEDFIGDDYSAKGHSGLEAVMESRYGGFDKSYTRFRVFLVDGNYYFTAWYITYVGLTREQELYQRVVKLAGLDVNKVFFEVPNRDVTKKDMEFIPYLEVYGDKKPEPKPKVDAVVKNEILDKLTELRRERAEAEAESHVKGATWTKGEENSYKLKIKNLDVAIEALRSAYLSGERDISKVIIQTIDKLEDEDNEVYIPAVELYRELETKLSKYGTSVISILRKLKSMGVNPKSMLQTIRDKHGKNEITAESLLFELENYMKTNLNESEDYSQPQDSAGILDIIHEIDDVVFVNLRKTLSDEEFSKYRSSRGAQMLSPDGSDAFKQKGTINLYLGGLDPKYWRGMANDVVKELKRANVQLLDNNWQKVDTSKMGGTPVLRFNIQLPEGMTLQDLPHAYPSFQKQPDNSGETSSLQESRFYKIPYLRGWCIKDSKEGVVVYDNAPHGQDKLLFYRDEDVVDKVVANMNQEEEYENPTDDIDTSEPNMSPEYRVRSDEPGFGHGLDEKITFKEIMSSRL